MDYGKEVFRHETTLFLLYIEYLSAIWYFDNRNGGLDMANKMFIPACYKYILKKDKTPDTQRIFSLAKSAYITRYADQKPDDKELFQFLKTNNILPHSAEEDSIDKERPELCFTIISQYKCNSICQLCGYSPLYKNQYETEESILIGFAISNWNNLQNLIQSGISCRHFRAMIPVSEKSSICVVPVNRLAFEYMEKIPKCQNDMLHITDSILDTLHQNNKNKLSSSDFKIIKKYLDNLFNSGYQNLNPEKIHDILKKCFNLSYKKEVVTDVPTPLQQENQSVQRPLRLDGFLSGKSTTTAGNRTIPKEIPGKKEPAPKPQENKVPVPAADKEEPLPPKPVADTVNTGISVHLDTPDGHVTSGINNLKTQVQVSYTSTCTPKENDKHASVLERNIQEWILKKNELQSFRTINLDTADKFSHDQFLYDLLLTPLLPMEIVTIDHQEFIFMYANGRIYYYEKTNSTILDSILPYITRSKFRKILCYEPYALYSFFHYQDIHNVSIFSIRTALDFTNLQAAWNYSPAEIMQRIFHIQNPDQATDLIYCLRNYGYAYRQLISEMNKMNEMQLKEYSEKLFLQQILGYSYERSQYCPSPDKLFSRETFDSYIFSFNPEEALKAPYISVCFHIAWNSKEPFPSETLLSRFGEYEIFQIHEIALLMYDDANIAFVLHPMEYPYLCELMNTLVCWISEERKKLPVKVDERFLYGKIENLAARP